MELLVRIAIPQEVSRMASMVSVIIAQKGIPELLHQLILIKPVRIIREAMHQRYMMDLSAMEDSRHQ
jgi:hypothetical protein